MNGATIGYNHVLYPPANTVQMRSDDVAFWETDEKEPKYFNDGASYPKEGVSARHELGAINAAFGGQVIYIRIDAGILPSPKRTEIFFGVFRGVQTHVNEV